MSKENETKSKENSTYNPYANVKKVKVAECPLDPAEREACEGCS